MAKQYANPLDLVSESGMRLYGIFEGALIKDLWINLDVWDLVSRPLYRGNYEPIERAIPYLIHLDRNSDEDACASLLTHMGKNAVLFIKTKLDIDTLLQKFQNFYHIKLEGEAYLRRFYDPRVFNNFLKEINAEEMAQFFDGINSYYCENERNLLEYSKDGNKIAVNKIKLDLNHEK